jgi:hypothetical protein
MPSMRQGLVPLLGGLVAEWAGLLAVVSAMARAMPAVAAIRAPWRSRPEGRVGIRSVIDIRSPRTCGAELERIMGSACGANGLEAANGELRR